MLESDHVVIGKVTGLFELNEGSSFLYVVAQIV